MSEKQRLELTILGEALRLRAEEQDADRIKRAAQYLDQKIATLRKAAGPGANLQLSVLAGLDVAHELLQEREGASPAAREQTAAMAAADKRIGSLIARLDKELV